jgi:hypothetical protein
MSFSPSQFNKKGKVLIYMRVKVLQKCAAVLALSLPLSLSLSLSRARSLSRSLSLSCPHTAVQVDESALTTLAECFLPPPPFFSPLAHAH